MPEVVNAIQQALKEITTRYDLKDSKSTIELNEKDKKIELASKDEFKLKAVIEILRAEAGEAQSAAEEFRLRNGDSRRWFDRAAGSDAATGHCRSRRRARS